jgi:electron transport complex protein RnfC
VNLRTFFGILPAKIKYQTGKIPLEEIPMPKTAAFLIDQKDCKNGLAVGVGDEVSTGQMLVPGEPGPCFSTVTGTVKTISDFEGLDNKRHQSVVIGDIKEDQWIKRNADDPGILKSLGFPMEMEPGTVDTVIISGIDIDPVSSVNQQALLDNMEQIRQGIKHLRRLTQAKKAYLAVSSILRQNVTNIETDMTEIVGIWPVYPNGHPEIIRKRIIEEDPSVNNCFYVGAQRLLEIVQALEQGRPPVEKVVTLSGKGIGQMKNIQVRIGTPVAEVLREYNISLQSTDRVLLGGVMNGLAVYNTEYPIKPDTDSIYIQDTRETVPFESLPCMNCGKCAQVCPVDLEVNLICRYSEYAMFDMCKSLAIENCIDCGLCTYSCMARRPLGQLLSLAKNEIPKLEEVN